MKKKSSTSVTSSSKKVSSKKQKQKARAVTAELVDHAVAEKNHGSQLGNALHDIQENSTDFESEAIDNYEGIDNSDNKSLPSIKTEKLTSKNSLVSADPMTVYLASIRKYPLLSKEEEQKLAHRYYETKDPEAAQALVTSNLRFVVKVAAEYSKFGAKLIDLVQEGNIGLMHAVREFNPFKGVRLITYAVWWIRGYIQEYLMKQYSLVRIGTTQNQKKLFYQLQKEKNALDALGENPDYAKLSEKLNIPIEEIEEMSGRLVGRDVSLDRPLDDDAKATIGDLQSNEEHLSLDENLSLRENLTVLKEQVDNLRDSLSEKEKIILDERLLADEPLTLQEIGEKYGITREAVRQMETRVLNKIRIKFFEATNESEIVDKKNVNSQRKKP